jgi:RimJ/RimL family protein N-acetyltransferase
MTTTGEPESADMRAAQMLNELFGRLPTLPDGILNRLSEPLQRILSHSQLQILIYSAMQVVPGLERENFHSGTTGEDLLYWLQRSTADEAATSGEPIGRSSTQGGRNELPPRGSYRSASVTIRPLRETDLAPLYEAALDPRFAHRWRFRGTTPSPEAFRAHLFSDKVLAQFAVVPLARPENTLGLAVAYDADLWAGHCFVGIQRAAGPRQEADRGLMIEGLLVFIEYVFDHFSFHKLYFEVPEYNRALIEGAPVMRKEGTLRNHYYYGDRRWDQYLMAIHRDDWDEAAEPFRGEWADRDS